MTWDKLDEVFEARDTAQAEVRRLRKVLAIAKMPYVQLQTYTAKHHGTGYACSLQEVRYDVKDTWCHDADAFDPPFYYHESAEAAWACFDEHHPGLRKALQPEPCCKWNHVRPCGPTADPAYCACGCTGFDERCGTYTSCHPDDEGIEEGVTP
jgi:hypothetical protein